MSSEPGVRRSWFLTPLLASLAVALIELWGASPCDHGPAACRDAWEFLDWTSLLFPHAFAFPLMLTPLGAGGTAAVLVALDVALVAGLWLTQPPRISFRRLAALLAGWLLLSAAGAWAAPELMALAWGLQHR